MTDYLIYKVECFDIDAYLEELKDCGKGIVVLMKWGKTQELWVKDRLVYKFLGNPYFDLIISALIMGYYLLRYRPKLTVIENTYLCGLIGWIKVGKLISFGGDWLPNKVFKIADFLACKWADVSWDTTPLINQQRTLYWGRNITKKVIIYVPRLRKNFLYYTSKGVLFLGTIREDSGLELCRNIRPFRLRTPNHCPREEFKHRFSGCFCGINLITSKDSWTIYTTPSKIFDYLQFGLPPVVSDNCGYMAQVIKEYQLGEVIKPTYKELMKALQKVYSNSRFYRRNIENFIKTTEIPRLKEVFNA